MNNWQKIWDNDDRVNEVILEALIKADGFDSGAGNFGIVDWLEYVNIFYKKIDLHEKDSIYEIGCGSGAFIHPPYLNGHAVGGMDYSKSAISLAKVVMPNSDFICDEATNIDTHINYDFIISHSVFHYFESLEYARDVIKKMVRKANKAVAIFDINDKVKEYEYHKVRMLGISVDAYKKKYSGLEHLFYDKDWFEGIAKELNCSIEIFDQAFDKYTNSKLRFNVIIRKL